MSFISKENYKIMCKNFLSFRFCKFGKSCRFAHKEEDVQNVKKTELCRNIFFKRSGCLHGPRCHFLHNKNISPIDSKLQEEDKKVKQTIISIQKKLLNTEIDDISFKSLVYIKLEKTYEDLVFNCLLS